MRNIDTNVFLRFLVAALVGRDFGFGLAFDFAMAERDLAFAGARFAADFPCLSFAEEAFAGAVFLP